MSLTIDDSSATAELGYWIGAPFWNSGYCTEAVMVVIDYGFATLGLERVFAHHLTRNPASGRVMQNAGMIFEGTSTQRFDKRGGEDELRVYGLSGESWMQARSAQ